VWDKDLAFSLHLLSVEAQRGNSASSPGKRDAGVKQVLSVRSLIPFLMTKLSNLITLQRYLDIIVLGMKFHVQFWSDTNIQITAHFSHMHHLKES
jgi:hypothetical protein